jgi:cell division septum initiation protein DivIVA
MEQLNIVELIESNPITKLSKHYNVKLLTKIKENFTDFEQQLFLASFYCYLNYHPNNDFILDLDNIWKWLGFQQKKNAISTLEKYFKLDIDYKNIAPATSGAITADFFALDQPKASLEQEKWGGHNIKKIFLTIKCFKSLCLKAGTKKADEIHDYYLKMENIIQEIIEEESNELKQQLQQKETVILEIKQTAEQEKLQLLQNSKKEKQKAIEQAIVAQFPVNTECIYFGTIDNTNDQGEKLIKFGHTNDLQNRIWNHRKTYDNFAIVKAFRVQNKVEIENLIKSDPKIKKHIRTIEINGKSKTEIISYDTTNFTIEKLSKYIQDIIHSKTYSIDNFNRIMKENEDMTQEIKSLKEQIIKHEVTINQQCIELNELKEKLFSQNNIIATVNKEEQSVFKHDLLPEDELTSKFNEFVDTICVVRPDVEELSTNLEGRYRLWSKLKPSKEVYHALKSYLDIRFRPKKLDAGNHGYIGVKLKPVEYTKSYTDFTPENFIFQVCKFSDSGKTLNSVLLQEYQKWKLNVGLDTSPNDMKDLKEYLNASPYVLKATVWSDQGSNEGYYGISLKDEIYKPKFGATTGKKVEKRLVESNTVISSWNSIADAATHENFSKAKMSRSVKDKTVFGDIYYCHVH